LQSNKGTKVNFSNKLVDLLRNKLLLNSDKDAAELIPHLNKQNLSAIRKGERHLTEEQAIWIGQRCELDCALILVELSEERAKSSTAKTVWHDLAKKLRATTKVVVVALILVVSATSGQYLPQRIRSIP
jgi:hypothetical protein